MRREWAVLLSSVILPMLATLVPWRYCVRLFWQLARVKILYRDQVMASLVGARTCLDIGDELGWKRRARFHLLIDTADYFLSRFRTRRWMLKNLTVSGEHFLDSCKPDTLFITFHWGQGFYALNFLEKRGFNLSWLHAPVPGKLQLGSYVSGLMGRLRIKQVGRLAGTEPIPVQGSIEKMRTRLVEKKQPVMAMPDAPLQPGQSFVSVKLLGRRARLPAGLIKMAAREKITLCVYTISIDQETGLRNLRFNAPVCEDSPDILAQYLADRLSEAVERDSSAWYVWPHAGGFFRSAINPDKPG